MGPSVPSTSGNSNHHLSDFNQHALKGMVAGAVAGAVSKTTVAPMDRVKLCLQLQHCVSAASTSSSSPSLALNCSVSSSPNQYNQYRGIVDCFRRLCAEQGVRSLWRGNSAAVIRCFPHCVLNLALRDHFRVAFLDGVERRKRPARFVAGNVAAGGAGAAVSLLFCYPLDFARTRLAVECTHRGVRQCLAAVHARDGLLGLYRGFLVSLQHAILSRAIFFGIFDSARLALVEERRGRALSFAATWCLAQASIVVSSLACYPLDTVRRRLMLEAGNRAPGGAYTTQRQCWAQAWRARGGMRALYNGALSNSLRCTSGALILAIYYEVLKYL